jgi:hypothetical protein
MMETTTLPEHTPMTDWFDCEVIEPPSGQLVYECLTPYGSLICDRGEVSNGEPAWGHRGVKVCNALKWRIIAVDSALAT